MRMSIVFILATIFPLNVFSTPIYYKGKYGEKLILKKRLIYNAFDIFKRVDLFGFFNIFQENKPPVNGTESSNSMKIDISEPEVLNVAEKVVDFVDALKDFVNGTHFDYLKFETHKVGLQNDIMYIQRLAENSLPSEQLLRQVNFASNMFRIMARSNRFLRQYKQTQKPLYSFFRKIIHLRVSALVLYNSYGAIDLRKEGYANKVMVLSKRVDALVGRYITWNLFRVPVDITLLCESEIHQTRKIIEDLQQQLPK